MANGVPNLGQLNSGEGDKSEEFSSNLLANVPNPIVVINPDGSIRYVNAALERVTGFSSSELIGGKPPYPWSTDGSLFHDISNPSEGAEAGTKRLERQLRRKDGTQLWVEMSGTPVIGNEVPGYYVLTWVDIDERKQAEEALRESERRYRLLTENVTDVIWVTDWKLNYTYISPSVELLRGYTAGETMAQGLEDILTPASLALTKTTFMEAVAQERKERASRSGTSTLELELKCKDGSTVWTEFKSVFLRDDQDQAIGTLGISRDISERKRVEAEVLRQSRELAALHKVMLSITQTLRLEEVLKEVVTQVGTALGSDYTRVVMLNPDGTVGIGSEHSAIDLKLPIDTEQNGVFKTVALEGKPVIINDLHLAGLDFHFPSSSGLNSCAAVPISSRTGIIGMLSVHSTLRNAFAGRMGLLAAFSSEAAIAIENARLYEIANAERSRVEALLGQLFTAQENERSGLSLELHDTVIQAMYGVLAHISVTEELLSQPEASELRVELGRAKRALEQTLVDLRRVITGLRPPALDTLGLPEALRRYVNGSIWNDDRIAFELRLEGIPRRLPASLEIGAYRIAQEAINNARRHADATEIIVLLAFCPESIRVEITDNGKGFEFTKGMASGATSEHLGLAGMMERAKLLGGTVRVDTQPGAGAKIVASIPLGQCH